MTSASTLWSVCRGPGVIDAREVTSSLGFRAFSNALKVLNSIDLHELIAAGGLKGEWSEFRKDPYEYFKTCGDHDAAVIWTAMQPRLRPEQRAIFAGRMAA